MVNLCDTCFRICKVRNKDRWLRVETCSGWIKDSKIINNLNYTDTQLPLGFC